MQYMIHMDSRKACFVCVHCHKWKMQGKVCADEQESPVLGIAF